MQPTRLRLGQLLVDARIITPGQLESVLELQKADGRRLGTLLVETGLVTETQLTQILSQQLSVPWVSLYHIDFSRDLLSLVPREVAERYCLVPIYVRHVRGVGDTLYVAMDDPMNDEALAECSGSSGLPTRAMIAAPSDIRRAVRVYYMGAQSIPSVAVTSSIPGDALIEVSSEPAPELDPEREAASRGAANGAPAAPRRIDDLKTPVPGDDSEPPSFEGSRHESEPPEVSVTLGSLPPDPPPSADQARWTDLMEDERPGDPLGSAPADRSSGHMPSEPTPPARAARGRGRARGLSLTFLDGTTIAVPNRAKRSPETTEGDARELAEILSALRAASGEAPSAQAGGGEPVRWERVVAALVTVLVRKHLVFPRELLDELRKI